MDKKITLVRHGQTKGNSEKRYIGITDEPLSEEGRLQILGKSYPEAQIVFASPLLRCQETARLIYPQKEIHIIEDFRETDFGLFEGKNYKELSGNLLYQKWIDSNGTMDFPEGESREDADNRFLKGFELLLEESRDYKEVVAIVHGGTIMAILSKLFGGDYYSYHVENGEGYTFDLSFDGFYSGLCFRQFNR